MKVGLLDRWAYELHWQQAWEEAGVHRTQRRAGRKSWFVVELPPYANGRLHIGHVRNYTIGDAVARYRRKLGYDVLYTTGFDAFGLPIETAARAANKPPYDLVDENMVTMSAMFRRLGYSHDRSLTISDHEPPYFRWVQWVFLKFYEAGLIYRARGPVNWCNDCHTTLAENLVESGCCWRCKTPVETRIMDRWFIREVELAQMVEDRPEPNGWPKTILKIHKDWVGARPGYEAVFELFEAGAIMPSTQSNVYASKPEEFLSARAVRLPKGDEALLHINCFDGLMARSLCGKIKLPVEIDTDVRRDQRGATLLVTDDKLTPTGGHPAELPDNLKKTLRTRLRDWDIARPRAWGTPVPMVICESCGVIPVPEHELPITLPDRFDATASNPLTEIAAFRDVPCPACGEPAQRETDTLEAYSSPWWYYLIASRPEAENIFRSQGVEDWMPVNTMIGGVDQARTCFFHLRTTTVGLNMIGATDETDPVSALVAVGMVKRDNVKMSKSAGNGTDPAELLDRFGADALRIAVLWGAAPEQELHWSDDVILKAVSLLKAVRRYCGAYADTFESGKPAPVPRTRRARRALNWIEATERKVKSCMETNAFHFAITQIARLITSLEKAGSGQVDNNDLAPILSYGAERILHLLSPYAPHLAEELWAAGGGSGLIAAMPLCQEAQDELTDNA